MKKPIQITYDDKDNADTNVYTEDDFIFCKKPNGEITSCGFSVNSRLLREGKSPIMGMTSFLHGNTKDDNDAVGDSGERSDKRHRHNNVADLFKNMSVPAGIFYIQQKNPSSKQDHLYEDEDISDDLFDKLLNLASENEKRKRGTRKARVVLVAGNRQFNKSKKATQKNKI
jgi:hypothetical protein